MRIVEQNMKPNTILLIAILLGTTTVRSENPGHQTRFRDLLTRGSTTEWVAATNHGISLVIPHSPEWKVSDVGVSPFDAESIEGAGNVLRFGRPIDAGTYITREYRLFRQQKRDLSTLQEELSGGCEGHEGARITTVGDIQCLRYFEGGAKGCAVGVTVNKGDFTYFLYRSGDMGDATPDCDEEMARIVSSIE